MTGGESVPVHLDRDDLTLLIDALSREPLGDHAWSLCGYLSLERDRLLKRAGLLPKEGTEER